VTDHTTNWVAFCGSMALTSPEEVVRGGRTITKLQILQMRHRLSTSELRRLDGSQLLATAIENEWAGFRSADVTLGEIWVDADKGTAEAEMIANGVALPPDQNLRFRWEQGTWKFDLAHYLVDVAEPTIQNLLRKPGLSEDDAILDLLTRTSGRPVSQDIWKPAESRP
jgi:hypothetical protein